MDAEKPKVTSTGKPITQAPGPQQFLVDGGTSFEDVLEADQAGKFLVFDILDFPEISRVNLGKLSPQARTAYQMDMRNANRVSEKMADGQEPFATRLEVINKRDPLARRDDAMRRGQARKIPKGMKHLNVGTHEVEELERIGWRKAKPDEVDIVGAVAKSDRVVLMNPKGGVDNVTMLVDAKDYEKHRQAERAKTDERLNNNIESTRENLKQYDSRVTVFDKSDLIKKK